MNLSAVSFVAPAADDSKPRNIQEAAEAFEALLIGQLLKSAREAASVDDEAGGGSGPMLEFAEECFSREIAKGSGCGLARSILRELQPPEPRPQNERSRGRRSLE